MRPLVLLATLVAVAVPATAGAEPTEVVYERLDPQPDYGVGVIAGTTVGGTGKVYMNPTMALTLSAGSYHFHQGVSLEAGFVWEPVELLHTPGLTLPFYVGAGARLSHWDHESHMHSDLAARVPVGVAAELGVVPLDVFVEAALDVNLVHGNAEPHRRAAITAALGSRLFF